MPDLSLKPNLVPLHAWLIEAGTSDVAAETLFDGFCGRLAAAGVPIARGFLSIAGLHPLRRAYSLTWNDGRIAEVTDFGHATMATAVWQTSPFRHMLETKTRRLHRRLMGDDAVLDFEVLREFRDAGMSEWLALMYGFSWSAAQPATNPFGVVLSWTTSAAVGRGRGWRAPELAAIEDLSGTLALAIKGNTAPAAAHDLLAAYLGGDAADRVSAGQVQRGSVSRIAAAILFADVRGFTNFAEETVPEEVTRRLNGRLVVLVSNEVHTVVAYEVGIEQYETGRVQWAPSWSNAQRRDRISLPASLPTAKASTRPRSFSRAFIARFVGPSMNGLLRQPGCARPSRPRDHLA